MKKFLIMTLIIFTFGAVFSVSCSAFSETTVPPSTMAEEQEAETAVETTTTTTLPPDEIHFEYFSELYDYWHKTAEGDVPYPDYVCGVWSTDGGTDRLTVALVTGEKGQKGKEEILSMIEDHDSVVFDYKPYTYLELNGIKEKLTAQLAEMTRNGIVSFWGVGVYERENVVHVDIDTTIPEVQTFIDDCDEKYGNMVTFEHTDGIVNAIQPAGRVDVDGPEGVDIGAPIPAGGDIVGLMTDAPADKPEWYYTTAGEMAETGEVVAVVTNCETDGNNYMLFWAAGAAVVMIVVTGAFIVRKNRVAQTTAGTAETAENITSAQVEVMLKNTSESPSAETFEKIMGKLEE